VWISALSLFVFRFASYHFRLGDRGDLSIGVGVCVLVTLHVLSFKICVMVHMALKFAKKRKFIYELWEEYKMTHGGDWEGPLKRRAFWTLLICWGFTLSYSILIFILFYINDSSLHFQKQWVVFSCLPVTPEGFIGDVLTLVYQFLFICYPTAVMYMMLGLFFILITDITQDFEGMSEEFEKTLDACEPSKVHETLHLFHEKHRILCEFLHEVDDLFSPMVLSVFGCGILVICLAIYTAAMGPSSDEQYWILSITIPVAAFFMTLMVVLALIGTKLSRVVSL
jgi:hypothetical protein